MAFLMAVNSCHPHGIMECWGVKPARHLPARALQWQADPGEAGGAEKGYSNWSNSS